MSNFLWQSFISLFVIIDPFVVVPVFVSLTIKASRGQRIKIAKKTCLISGVLLVFFALFGEQLLSVMGISSTAFRIAGGLLLLLAAIEMVMAKPAVPTDDDNETEQSEDIAVFPLAIPLIAGPGSMTSVVVLMGEGKQFGAAGGIGVVLITMLVLYITYQSMHLSKVLMKMLGETGMNVMTRVFGVIVAALATQNIVNGITIMMMSMR